MVCSSSSSSLSVAVREGVAVVMVTTGGGFGIGLVWLRDGDRAATTELVAGGEGVAGEVEAVGCSGAVLVVIGCGGGEGAEGPEVVSTSISA